MSHELARGDLIDRYLQTDSDQIDENGEERVNFEEDTIMASNGIEGEAENDEWCLDESWECEEDAKETDEASVDDRVNQGISNLFKEYRVSGDEDQREDSMDQQLEAVGDSEGDVEDHLLEAPQTPDEDENASGEEGGVSVFEKAEEEANEDYRKTTESFVDKPKIRPVAKFRVKAHPPPRDPPPPPPAPPVQVSKPPAASGTPASVIPPQHVRVSHVRGPSLNVRAPVSKASFFAAANNAKSDNLVAPAVKVPVQPRPRPPNAFGTVMVNAPFAKAGATSSPARPPPPPPAPAVVVPVRPRPIGVGPKVAPVRTQDASTSPDASLRAEVEAYGKKKKLSQNWIDQVSSMEPSKIRKIIEMPEPPNVDKVKEIITNKVHKVTEMIANQKPPWAEPSALQKQPIEGRKPPRQPSTPPPAALCGNRTAAVSSTSDPSAPADPQQKPPVPKWRPSAPEPPWKPPPKNLLEERSPVKKVSEEFPLAASAHDKPDESLNRPVDFSGKSNEELEQEATKRMEDSALTAKDLQMITRMQESCGLGDEGVIGLRFLHKDKLRKLFFHDEIETKLLAAPLSERSEIALTLIGTVDPSAESLVRHLQNADVPAEGENADEPDLQEETTEVPAVGSRTLGGSSGGSGIVVPPRPRKDLNPSETSAHNGDIEQTDDGETETGKTKITLNFSAHCLPRIVGKEGKHVKKVRADTNAEVKVSKMGNKTNKWCEVAIAGDATAVEVAKKLVIEYAWENPLTNLDPPQEDEAGTVDVKIQVDGAEFKSVLGVGGKNIKNIRDITGAQVILKPLYQDSSGAQDGKKAFHVNITGTTSQVEKAQAMIDELVNNPLAASNSTKPPIDSTKPQIVKRLPPAPPPPPPSALADSSQREASGHASSGKVEMNGSDSVVKVKPAKGSVNEEGIIVKPRSRSPRRNAKPDPIKDWLQGLDESGDMMIYLDRLRKNFSNLTQLVHVQHDTPENGKTALSCIEPDFFVELQVESLGHKLMLAKGIIALSSKTT